MLHAFEGDDDHVKCELMSYLVCYADEKLGRTDWMQAGHHPGHIKIFMPYLILRLKAKMDEHNNHKLNLSLCGLIYDFDERSMDHRNMPRYRRALFGKETGFATYLEDLSCLSIQLPFTVSQPNSAEQMDILTRLTRKIQDVVKKRPSEDTVSDASEYANLLVAPKPTQVH